MTTIHLPELCLVALIGASGSGKTTLSRQLFAPGEVLSSDAFRLMVANDENAQDATRDAFDSLYFVARKRLARGLLTVIDATNVQADARKRIVSLAKEFDVLPVAIVLDLPEDTLLERHRARTDRPFGAHVIGQQVGHLRRSLRKLQGKGSGRCRCSAPKPMSARPGWCGSGCTTTCGTRPARSISSGTCTAAWRNCATCSGSWGTRPRITCR
ncbi:AAA family ATPase [Deinococcus malanensis]|uniref:AAA family ATPase n=1 Tax=Deinococcus malanensis TaxID=1706855 RepID=UPI0036457AA1